MLGVSHQIPSYIPPTPKIPQVQYLKDEIIIQGFETMAGWSKYEYCTNLEEVFRKIEEMKIEKEGNEELIELLELYFNERELPNYSYCASVADLIDDLDNQDLRFSNLVGFNSYNNTLPMAFQTISFDYWDKDRSRRLIALQFHLGGDIRGNYSEFVFLEERSEDEFLWNMAEFSFEFITQKFAWYEDFWSEEGHICFARVMEDNKRLEQLNGVFDALSGYYYDRYPKVFVEEYERIGF